MIRMFDDRVEILSPGGLLRPLTIEQLDGLNYIPKSRNKTLVDALMRRKLMDKRGTGILRMKNSMEEWSLPGHAFEERQGYFVIKFGGPYKETTIEIVDKLNERQKEAIDYLKTNFNITPKDYIKLFKVSDKTARNDLKDLEKRGYIIFT